jgi:pheromone alpha factor receptor
VWSEEIANQTVNLTDIFGNVNTFHLSDFDNYALSTGQALVLFGVSMGMCLTIAAVLLLLTKAEKRRTPIFALNMAGLVLNFLRMLMYSILETGPGFTIPVAFLQDTSLLPERSFVPLWLYTFVTIPWYFVIITSLVLQVRVVFGLEPKAQKYLTWALGLLGLVTMAFNITGQAEVFKANLSKTGDLDSWYPWIENTGHILYTVTIGIASLIFVAKLMYLIHRRQRMGFKGFGPLQVIVIMGAQCLIVPRIRLSVNPTNRSCLYDHRLLCGHHRGLCHPRPNVPDLLSPTLCSLGLC